MLKSLYLSTNGRINRKTYIFFGLVPYLLSIRLLHSMFSSKPLSTSLLEPYTLFFIFLFTFILMMTIKRAHDLGHSGWGLLFLLIPGVNILVFLYLTLLPGESGDNEYGAQPKNWSPG